MTSLGCRTVLYMAKTGVGHRCLPQQCSNYSKRPRQGRSSSQVPKSLSLLLHATSEPVWARHSGVDPQSQNMGAEADCSKFQSSLWVPGQPGLKQEALSPKQSHGNNKLLLPALSSWSLKQSEIQSMFTGDPITRPWKDLLRKDSLSSWYKFT